MEVGTVGHLVASDDFMSHAVTCQRKASMIVAVTLFCVHGHLNPILPFGLPLGLSGETYHSRQP